jgi:hypothetical protein
LFYYNSAWHALLGSHLDQTGGSGSPAGNYGNIQLNRFGVFSTPSSDTLIYTTSGGLQVKNSITAVSSNLFGAALNVGAGGVFAGTVTLAEAGSISTPGSGNGTFWVKNDNTPHFINDLGVDIELGAAGGSGANALGTYLVQTSTNAPANAQVMGSLATGLVKNTTSTGLQSIAVAGTDYLAPSGDGSGLQRISKVLISNFTDVGNVGTGEDDLMGANIGGGTLSANGDYLEFTMTVVFAANANNKQVRLKYGSTTVYASGAQAQNGGTMEIVGRIQRTGATTQRISFRVSTSTTNFPEYADYVTAAETLSGTTTLKLTGEATSDNDIIQKINTVEFKPKN